jgi:hypothetical protein
VAYQCVLGLSFTALRYHSKMNHQLALVAETTVAAATVQTKAAWDETEASTASELAALDEEESVGLQRESQSLLEASERDEAVARADSVAVEEWQAQAVVEQGESEVRTATAALAAESAQVASKHAASETVVAARYQSAALDNELAIGLCQWIPLADIACDVLGGATVVLEEGLATDAALASVAEAASASAAVAEENIQSVAAAQAQELAVVDTSRAASLEQEALAASIRSKEEAGAAAQLQVEALELQEKAQAEEDYAVQEAALAAAEQDEVEQLLKQASVHGVKACGYGLMASILGIVAVSFFALRLLFALLVGAWKACLARDSRGDRPRRVASASKLLLESGRWCSWTWHHGMAVMAAVAILHATTPKLLPSFVNYGIRDRGEVILRLACLASLLQTLILHTFPFARLRRPHGSILVAGCDVVLFAMSCFIILGTLVIMEFLLLWVVAGARISVTLSMISPEPWLFFIGAISIPLHWVLCDEIMKHNTPSGTEGLSGDRVAACTSESVSIVLDDSDPEKWEDIGESTPLLVASLLEAEAAYTAPSLNAVFLDRLRSFWDHAQLLLYPLEILVNVTIFLMLSRSIALLRQMWPVAKELILRTLSASQHRLLVGCGCFFGMLSLLGVTVHLWRRWRR